MWSERVSVMNWSTMVSQDIISMVGGVVVSVVSINISMVSNNVVRMVSSVELSMEVSVVVIMVLIVMWDIDIVVDWCMVNIMSIVVMGGKDGIFFVLSLLGWSIMVNIMVDLVVDWSWSCVVWHIVMG